MIHPTNYSLSSLQAAAFAGFNMYSAFAGCFGPYAAGALPRETSFYMMAALQVAAAAILLAFGVWEDRDDRKRAARAREEEGGKAVG